ncbi:MAG TPA: CoA transferase, partial [Dehalococcoidia bacterium]|nr:CoA transferase [Dehalococcoidia bacterium]
TPLEGVRVLDLTHHIAGPHCTKILADWGADVLKIERPPGGDPSRQYGPFHKDDPHPEKSALFLHLNTNKRSMTLNLKSAEGRSIVERLLPEFDIVVENFRPGVMDSLGLGYQTLAAQNPRIILTSISNFGQTGPYRDLKASEITEFAMGGPMNVNGHREHFPLKLGGNVVQYQAGGVAAYATLLALWQVEMHGAEGQHNDISIYETQAGFRDRRTTYLVAHAYGGEIGRRPETAVRPGLGIRPCKDGYVNIYVTSGEKMKKFLSMIGREDLLSDPRTDAGMMLGAMYPDLGEEIEASYLGWLMERGKLEAATIAQEHTLLAAPVNTVADLLNDPSYRERGFFETIDHPATGPLTYPGRPFIMNDSPRPLARRAPLLGEHTKEVLCGRLGYSDEDLTKLRAQGVI